jgi:hypothetical protein
LTRTCLGPETSKIAILRGYGYDSKKARRYLCRNYGCVDISVAIWGVSISLSQFGVCRYLCRNLGCVDISVAIWGMSISLSQVFLPGGCPGPSDDCEMRQRYRHTLICDRDIDTTYFATEISTNPKLRQRYRQTLNCDRGIGTPSSKMYNLWPKRMPLAQAQVLCPGKISEMPFRPQCTRRDGPRRRRRRPGWGVDSSVAKLVAKWTLLFLPKFVCGGHPSASRVSGADGQKSDRPLKVTVPQNLFSGAPKIVKKVTVP